IVSENGHEVRVAARRVLELLAKLVPVRVHVASQGGPAQVRSGGPRFSSTRMAPDRHHHIDGSMLEASREHASLRHDDDNPLEAERKPASRDVAAEKHADQIVVSAAPTQTSR